MLIEYIHITLLHTYICRSLYILLHLQLPPRHHHTRHQQKRRHIDDDNRHDDDDNRYNYFYDVEQHTTVPSYVPKLILKTNDKCRQSKDVWGIYESQHCCTGEKIYYTCNNMGLLTRLSPYSTTGRTITLFYYNPHTHHVWIAKEDTHAPYYLQEQLLSPQNLQFQLSNAVIAPFHPIYLPLTTILDHN